MTYCRLSTYLTGFQSTIAVIAILASLLYNIFSLGLNRYRRLREAKVKENIEPELKGNIIPLFAFITKLLAGNNL